VIKIFYHARVGRTTTEVAFEFPSVVLEPNIPDPNFRVADIRTEWPTSRQSVTNVGILHKSADSVPFSMQDFSDEARIIRGTRDQLVEQLHRPQLFPSGTGNTVDRRYTPRETLCKFLALGSYDGLLGKKLSVKRRLLEPVASRKHPR
jgi:hypothetical protein